MLFYPRRKGGFERELEVFNPLGMSVTGVRSSRFGVSFKSFIPTLPPNCFPFSKSLLRCNDATKKVEEACRKGREGNLRKEKEGKKKERGIDRREDRRRKKLEQRRKEVMKLDEKLEKK